MMRKLPSGWRHDRLKDVSSIRNIKTTEKSVIEDYLELEDIESWTMKILNRRSTLDVESAVTMFKAGDVLFGKLRPYLAKVCRPDFDGKCTGEILAIRPCHVDGGFLKYALIEPGNIDKCTEFSYGAKMPRVNWATQLSTFDIPLPPLTEQSKIAAFLDAKCADIDKAIAAKREQIGCLEDLWANLLSRAVLYGCLGSPLITTKSKIFDKIPKGWRVERLKKFFKYAKGLNFTKADLEDDGVRVISYGQIHSKQNFGSHLQESLVRHIPRELTINGNVSKLKMGDIVFADTSEDLAGVGNCIINDEPGEIFAGYHTLIAKARFPEHSKYLSYLFQTGEWREQIRKRVCGIKVFSLTQRVLGNVEILIPPLEEQKKIVVKLDSERSRISNLSANLHQQIETLEQYRKSLIHEYVTGARRV